MKNLALPFRPNSATMAQLTLPHCRIILLGLTLAIALALRLWGLSWGLPWALHPDEGHYVDRSQAMLEDGEPNPRYFNNPSLLTYLVAGELTLARLVWPSIEDQPAVPYLLARATSAALGTFGVALVAVIGARLFSDRVGLAAAVFLALSFLHVRDSHYGVNDVPSVSFLLLSLYCAVRLLAQPTWRWYLLAGLCGGLATSTKYNMGFFFIPLLVAHFLATTRRGSAAWSGGALLGLGLAAGSSLLGFLLGTPYALLDRRRFRGDFSEQLDMGDDPWLGQSPEPVPLQYLLTLVQGFGLLPLVLVAIGVVCAWRHDRSRAVLLLSFPVVYLAFMLPKELFFVRFALPLLPFCCLFAAYGTWAIVRPIRPAWQPFSFAAVLLLALAQSLGNDLRHNQLLLQADTRILAVHWVQLNLPARARLAMSPYALQDTSWQHNSYLSPDIEDRIGPIEFGPDGETIRGFRERNVQYIALSSFIYERTDPESEADKRSRARSYLELYRQLERNARLVARFSPGTGSTEVPFSLDSLYTPFWDLGHYERPGPTIRIYALTPAALATRDRR